MVGVVRHGIVSAARDEKIGRFPKASRRQFEENAGQAAAWQVVSWRQGCHHGIGCLNGALAYAQFLTDKYHLLEYFYDHCI